MIDRYDPKDVAEIWSEENKFRTWLRVELEVCKVLAERGWIPGESLSRILAKADFSLARIQEIEQVTHHDLIAFTTSVAEHVGPDARYIHWGLTSTDVVDTAQALQLIAVNALLLAAVDEFMAAVRARAEEHRHTVMIGRTHGVHAEVTTLGLKLAVWYEEMRRNRDRLLRAAEILRVGKISGAVGTYAHLDPDIEEAVCRQLGLEAARIFLGYDVVDNAYFETRTKAARMDPEPVRRNLALPERYLLTCCRFIEKKNLFRLLDAFRIYTSSAASPWHLVLCGDGPLRVKLEAHADGDPLVHFPGFVQLDRLPDYYALASGFILPSVADTWGLVVNEAMASGLPVLVSEEAGCRQDLLEDGRNGFAFDPFQVEDMAGAIVRLSCLSDEERARMGACGRRLVGQWGLDRFAEGLLAAVHAGMEHARLHKAPSLFDRALLGM